MKTNIVHISRRQKEYPKSNMVFKVNMEYLAVNSMVFDVTGTVAPVRVWLKVV